MSATAAESADSASSEEGGDYENRSSDGSDRSQHRRDDSSRQDERQSGFNRRHPRHRGSQSPQSDRQEDSHESADRNSGYGKLRSKVRQIIQQLQTTLKDLNEVLNLLNLAEKERLASEEELSSLRKELNQALPRNDASARRRFPPTKPHRRRGRLPNANPGHSPQGGHAPSQGESESDRERSYSDS